MRCLTFLVATLFLATGAPQHVSGEIEELTVRWYAGITCSGSCLSGLQGQLSKLPGAVDVQMDGPGSSAYMRWKPRVTFKFSDLNVAIRAIGVSFSDLHITLRGTITHTGNKVTVTSLGDETSFFLLSPLVTLPYHTATPNNPDSYSLQPDTYQKLLTAEEQYRVVKISGTMLMPWRSPPNYLIIESLEIPTSQGPEPSSSSSSSPNSRPLFNPQPQETITAPQPAPPATATPSANIPLSANRPLANIPLPANRPSANTPLPANRPLFAPALQESPPSPNNTSPPEHPLFNETNSQNENQGITIPGATSNRPLFLAPAHGTTIPGATSNVK